MTLLNPRVDLAFKKFFGTEENKDLLISLINSLVAPEDQVVDIEILNPYNSRNFVRDKQSILDIKAKDSLGNYYDIEMQICNEGDYEERALLCQAKLYADQLKAGDPYTSLRRAIGIHVLNFSSVVDSPDYHNRFFITNPKTGLCFFKHLELHTIELNKFTHSADENINLILPRIKNGLDRWSAFLTRSSNLSLENLPKELEDPCIKKALEVLTNASLNEEEREAYEGRLQWLRIEASALEKAKSEGRVEGEVKKAREIAHNLLRSGIAISIVTAASGLSEEEIRSL